jgi:hypothetical protein
VFQFFHPSLIANYNHDGLAEHFCKNIHAVLDMHGTVDPEYGAPSIVRLVDQFRDIDIPNPIDSILMGVSESFFDPHPAQRRFRRQLSTVAAFSPDFIAIIGYSFAQSKTGYDDVVSLTSFVETRRGFPGNIYIIQPSPDALCEMIADNIQSKSVFPVRTYWNVLAHAFTTVLFDSNSRKSLNYIYDQTLGKFGCKFAFPLDKDHGI